MDVLNDIYTAIAAEGLTAQPLQMIDNYANDIQNGREDFSRFNLSEHAGLCKGGSPLIGASLIACYASASLRASCNAEGRTGGPANWEIDEQQEIFPETAMKVIGFTRDSDGLMRIVLTQPYVNCLRLATKEEIDDMVSAKGFRDNWNGEGVNYISDRLALEDMHPANVFIDTVTGKPICIDCIVKFVSPTN